jgi:hypothetical protein
MVLAEKQTQRPIERTRRPRNNLIFDKGAKNVLCRKHPLPQMVLRKLIIYM